MNWTDEIKARLAAATPNNGLGMFLIHHGRQLGKTFNLAKLCKAIGASLIVRDNNEAKRVKAEFQINAYPYNIERDRLIGHQGIIYIDPDACGIWIAHLEREIECAKTDIANLLAAIEAKDEALQNIIDEKYSTPIRTAKIALAFDPTKGSLAFREMTAEESVKHKKAVESFFEKPTKKRNEGAGE